MNKYFAYIRVSDPRQGKGVSLGEQETAIRNHALQRGMEIVEWFRELETAATKGRRVFSQMLSRLEHGEADGVIIHKIDRSARNLEDWSNLGRLVDRGIDIQFAHDRIDLKSRGGRLSADIIAVVAADYIRNLREEVKKGFYGRLKQGLYPLPAPLGYLDRGAGAPKVIDPATAPLIKMAFEYYAKGTISIRDLREELDALGLLSRRNGHMVTSGLAKLLANPFYVGLIHINATNETFRGIHEPLISKPLFDRVQNVLKGKSIKGGSRHQFPYKGHLQCGRCGRALTGERQKKRYIYYRCHSETCAGVCVREFDIEMKFKALLESIVINGEELDALRDMVDLCEPQSASDRAAQKRSIQAQMANITANLERMIDALIEGRITKQEYDDRKGKALDEKLRLSERSLIETSPSLIEILKKFELHNTLILGYETVDADKQVEIRNLVSSNCTVIGKEVSFTPHSPYREMLELLNPSYGGPYKYGLRTYLSNLLDILRAQAGLPANDNKPAYKRTA